MLSSLTQSSKHITKPLKNKQKMKESGFQFLLQSLQRDKENTVPNLLTCKHQLTRSIHLDPLNTAPVHSFAPLNQTLNHQHVSRSPKFFIQNVKVLDRSDISISDPNQCHSEMNFSKKSSNKGYKNKNKDSKMLKSKIDESKTMSVINTPNLHNLFSQIIYKTKQYLTLTDQIRNNKQNHNTNTNKIAKKSLQVSQQLVSMITNYQNTIRNTTSANKTSSFLANSIKTSNLTTLITTSDILNRSKGQQQYVKIINTLQNQKDKLNSLISQHQMANIKMFIKINQGQSQQIQQCKKQLRLLFDKYKKLEGYLVNEKKEYCILIKYNEELRKQNKVLKNSNVQLISLVEKYQDMVEKQKNTKNQHKNMQVSEKKDKISNISHHHNPHSRHSNFFNFQANSFTKSFTKSQLRIQSLASQSKQNIYSKRSQDSLFGSSIKTNCKNRIKRDKICINLNALFQNLTQENLNKIREQPYKFKQIIKQCKSTIQTMEKIIGQQNQQLELSINSLEEFQRIIYEKENLIRNLENKWSYNLEKDKDKEREKDREKDKDREREKEERKIREREMERQIEKQQDLSLKNRKKQSNNRIVLDNIVKPKKQKQKPQKQSLDYLSSKRVLNTNLSQNMDEYRIIATQAACLQQFLKKNKIK